MHAQHLKAHQDGAEANWAFLAGNGTIPDHPYYMSFKSTGGTRYEHGPIASNFENPSDMIEKMSVVIKLLGYDAKAIEAWKGLSIPAYVYGAGINMSFLTLWQYHNNHAQSARSWIQGYLEAQSTLEGYSESPLAPKFQEDIELSWVVAYYPIMVQQALKDAKSKKDGGEWI